MPGDGGADEVSVRVLGPLEVRIHGIDVAVPAGTQRTLLAMLVLGRGRAVPRERLIDGLWAEEQPKDPRAALHTSVARLRRTLGTGGGALRTLTFGYLLELSPGSVDADRFTSLHAQARALLEASRAGGHSDAALAVRLLEEALALWRGPAWADVADGVASGEALRLEEERLVVLEDLAEALLATNAVDRAVAVAGALAAEHPLRDRAVALLVDALHRYGRTADALDVVERYRSLRAEELGLDPAPAVAAAHLRVLRQEHSQAPAAPAGPGLPNGPRRGDEPGRSLLPSDLVGRDEERARVDGLLRSTPVVSLVGPGGVGKTALARQVAAEWTAGSTWVDLAVVRDRIGVLQALADALGVEAGSRRVLEDLVLDRLAAEQALVVLDNCEHLLDDLAPLLVARPSSTRRVLVTSRERLAIPGEHVVTLGPLEVPHDDTPSASSPAVELFLRRAAEAGTRLGEDPVTRQRVGALCRALDGLPLALELAAGRVGALTLEDLLDRLDHRFEVLTRGPRTAPRRQQTLRAVFDWSHDLLDEDERRVFARLAVFPSGFTLSAAEAVVADERIPSTLVPDLLAGLVGRSMVPPPRASEGGRYRMLETIRQYALSRLAAVDLAETRRRHALWTIAQAELARSGLETAEEAGAHEAMTRLVDDLRAAWRWAGEAADAEAAGRLVAATWRWAYWRLRTDVLAWGARLLEAQGEHSPVAAYPAAVATAWLDADPAEGERWAEAAMRLHPGSEELADVHEVLGDVRMTEADTAGALEAYSLAERRHREQGDEVAATIARAEQLLPIAYVGGPWHERVDHVLRDAGRTGNPTALALARYAEAEACVAEDEARAREALDEALHLAESVGNRLITGIAMTASVALEARAATLEPRTWASFEAAIQHWATSRSSPLLITTLRNLVILLGRAGRHADAVELWAAVGQVQGGHHSYGREAERISQTLAEARKALGDGFQDAVVRGRMCSVLDDAARLGSRLATGNGSAASGQGPGAAAGQAAR